MTTPQDAQQFIGRTALDSEGSKIGKIGQVYLNEQTGSPLWITVATGFFGTRQVAPIHGSRLTGTRSWLSPGIWLRTRPTSTMTGISAQEQDALPALHSATSAAADRREAGYADGGDLASDPAGVRGGTSGPTTDEAMTRSEERLHVGTENVQTGRARLRKYVVTETVTTSVPVSHEEVRLEREPITEANRDAALSGPAISEEEHEVTLHAERPVVAKEPSRSSGSAWAPRPSPSSRSPSRSARSRSTSQTSTSTQATRAAESRRPTIRSGMVRSVRGLNAPPRRCPTQEPSCTSARTRSGSYGRARATTTRLCSTSRPG